MILSRRFIGMTMVKNGRRIIMVVLEDSCIQCTLISMNTLLQLWASTESQDGVTTALISLVSLLRMMMAIKIDMDLMDKQKEA